MAGGKTEAGQFGEDLNRVNTGIKTRTEQVQTSSLKLLRETNNTAEENPQPLAHTDHTSKCSNADSLENSYLE